MLTVCVVQNTHTHTHTVIILDFWGYLLKEKKRRKNGRPLRNVCTNYEVPNGVSTKKWRKNLKKQEKTPSKKTKKESLKKTRKNNNNFRKKTKKES